MHQSRGLRSPQEEDWFLDSQRQPLLPQSGLFRAGLVTAVVSELAARPKAPSTLLTVPLQPSGPGKTQLLLVVLLL